MLTKDNITGLILAGGAGRRVAGQDKGLLKLNGKMLIQRQIEWFQPQVNNILISANRNLSSYQRFGYPVLTDKAANSTAQKGNIADHAVKIKDKMLNAFNGPLFGLLQGLENCKTSHLFVLPVDQPFLPADVLARLVEYFNSQYELNGNDAKSSISGYLKSSTREHYLCLLIAKQYRDELVNSLANQNYRVKDFLKRCDINGIDLELSEAELANLNHSSDFSR